MTLCKYRNLLGEVGKGVHSYRIFDIAIVDVLLTFIGAYIIYIFNTENNYFIISKKKKDKAKNNFKMA